MFTSSAAATARRAFIREGNPNAPLLVGPSATRTGWVGDLLEQPCGKTA